MLPGWPRSLGLLLQPEPRRGRGRLHEHRLGLLVHALLAVVISPGGRVVGLLALLLNRLLLLLHLQAGYSCSSTQQTSQQP